MKKFLLLYFLCYSPLLATQTDSYSFIAKKVCKVDKFLQTNPTADGRGVIIIIVDTGIDPSISGLTITSDKKNKILNLVDASGFGDVYLEKSVIKKNQTTYTYTNPLTQFSLTSSTLYDSAWIGVFNESRLKNASLNDLDGDGKSTSEFGILVYKKQNDVFFIVDMLCDKTLDNDQQNLPYSKSKSPFFFEKLRRFLACAVNTYLDTKRPKINFFFDAQSHGTHVAGIASGCNLYANGEEKTFDGVAPGSQIIGIKISDANIDELSASGAMKRAFDYAAILSKTQPMPVVVNMSFGINSEIKENAAMERYVDSLLLNHPNLYVCISNGNEGPGIHTTGNPASSRYAISSGALLPKETNRDLFSTISNDDLIWDFGSRGGDVLKPDILAPASSFSTVPIQSSESTMSGTSMASPYTAGCVALLLSLLQQTDPQGMKDKLYSQAVIKSAIRYSARTVLSQPTAVDTHAGILDISAAYALLLQYKKSGFVQKKQYYNIVHPSSSDETILKSYAFYNTLSSVPNTENFLVQVALPVGTSEQTKNDFFEIYSLRSTANWVIPIQKNVIIKGIHQSVLSIAYDKSKLKTPGIYIGTVQGVFAKSTNTNEVAFEIPITIITPYYFSPEKDYTITFTTSNKVPNAYPIQTVRDGEYKRYYFAIPPTASSLDIEIQKESKSSLAYYVYDDEGNAVSSGISEKDSRYGEKIVLAGNKIHSGIYEVVITRTSAEENETKSSYSLVVSISQMYAEFKSFTKQHAIFSIKNYGTKTEAVDFYFNFVGYKRTITDTIYYTKPYRKKFSFNPNEKKINLGISFSKEDFGKATDVGLMIIDTSGRKVAFEGMDTRSQDISLYSDYNSKSSYSFEIFFSFALPTPKNYVVVEIEEKRFTEKQSSAMLILKSMFPPYSTEGVVFDLPNLPTIPEWYQYFFTLSGLSNTFEVYNDEIESIN